MIRRGMKKKVLQNKVQVKSCPICGAVGSAPCVSIAKANKGLYLQLQNNHKERKV